VTVPLSEREQRILEQIEKSLYEEDPKLANKARWGSSTFQLKLGIASFLAGFAFLIAFFIIGHVAVGVVAFGAMVAGIVLIANGVRISALEDESGEGRSGILKRLEQGLRERRKRD
jgi:VIT1/CCC1 family predicted Fe2+/Mn2+ transporter